MRNLHLGNTFLPLETKRKRLTMHRALTSDEVIEAKKEQEQSRCKKGRKEAKEQKRKLETKKPKRAVHALK